MNTPNPWGLSQRQSMSLMLASEGQTNKEIGRALGVSHRTVEIHLRAARIRMRAKNTLQAAILLDRFVREHKEPA